MGQVEAKEGSRRGGEAEGEVAIDGVGEVEPIPGEAGEVEHQGTGGGGGAADGQREDDAGVAAEAEGERGGRGWGPTRGAHVVGDERAVHRVGGAGELDPSEGKVVDVGLLLAVLLVLLVLLLLWLVLWL
jgi:hypothetical protein